MCEGCAQPTWNPELRKADVWWAVQLLSHRLLDGIQLLAYSKRFKPNKIEVTALRNPGGRHTGNKKNTGLLLKAES